MITAYEEAHLVSNIYFACLAVIAIGPAYGISEPALNSSVAEDDSD